ncbi:MAG: hypothetical protein ACI3XA_07945 [Clostridia bacterium]
MSIIKKLVLSVAVAAIICSVNVYAYSEDMFNEIEIKPADGFYTVITDTEGEEHTLDGIINTKLLEQSYEVEKIASYTIYSGDEEIISVKLNDIISEGSTILAEVGKPLVNGYYSVKFTLSETDNTEAFLTGLTDANLDMVQEKLIASKLEHSEFTMESLDFIDAEKTAMPNDGDNELCWAAATSNIIHYTGWGQKAGFNSTDDIFDLFSDSFTDEPGNFKFGLEWFFNGTYIPQTWDDWAKVKDYGNNGEFLNRYEVSCVSDYIDIQRNYKQMAKVTEALELGSGIGISLGWVDEYGNRNGGHSITMWGFICDRDFSKDDKDYYKAIVVSDSDSDIQAEENRRMAPNKLHVLNMIPCDKGIHKAWQFDGYFTGALENAIILVPYSENVEFETDERASLDKISDVDFTISDIYVSNDSADKNFFLNACAANENIYVVPEFYNTAETDFEGAVDYIITERIKMTEAKKEE